MFSKIICFSAIILAVSARSINPILKRGGDDEILQCHYDQIGNFTISGGGGTYEHDTIQPIIWDRPGNSSNIKTIFTNVSIYDTNLNVIYPQLNASGVPIYFNVSERSLSLNGVIGVEIPSDIPDGNSYVFRVLIRAKGCKCYLDSANFTITTVTPPNTCTTLGSLHCTNDLTGFQQCVDVGDHNELGDVVLCTETTHCVQITENAAYCAPPVNECTLDQTRCLDVNTSQVCISSNGGTVWSDIPCETGFECSSDTGTCVAPPECTLGETRCLDVNTSQVCTASGSSNVWIDVPCETGFACSSDTGTCVAPPQCTTGETRCLDAQTSQICNDNHEWIDIPCESGSICDSNTGVCTNNLPVECTPYHQICLSQTSFDSCLQDSNGLWVYGGVSSTCPTGTTCEVYLNDFVHCVA